jgi:hypothetical protein
MESVESMASWYLVVVPVSPGNICIGQIIFLGFSRLATKNSPDENQRENGQIIVTNMYKQLKNTWKDSEEILNMELSWSHVLLNVWQIWTEWTTWPKMTAAAVCVGGVLKMFALVACHDHRWQKQKSTVKSTKKYHGCHIHLESEANRRSKSQKIPCCQKIKPKRPSHIHWSKWPSRSLQCQDLGTGDFSSAFTRKRLVYLLTKPRQIS